MKIKVRFQDLGIKADIPNWVFKKLSDGFNTPLCIRHASKPSTDLSPYLSSTPPLSISGMYTCVCMQMHVFEVVSGGQNPSVDAIPREPSYIYIFFFLRPNFSL